jgi:hypothetical protein
MKCFAVGHIFIVGAIDARSSRTRKRHYCSLHKIGWIKPSVIGKVVNDNEWLFILSDALPFPPKAGREL